MTAAAMAGRVARNSAGRVIGEAHPRAVLSDHDVGLVLDLLEEGLSYKQVAEKMEVSKSCVAHVATGRRRCQTPATHVLPGERDKAGAGERKRGRAAAAATPVNQAALALQTTLLTCWR